MDSLLYTTYMYLKFVNGRQRMAELNLNLTQAISVVFAHEGGTVVSPTFTPRKYSWYSFLLEAMSTSGP
jgi:hypothetical protein